MKSLGPDAYINEDHPKKPAHISSAISEVLNQVGTPAKPTPGAKMPEKVPNAPRDGASDIPNDAPPKSQSSTNAPPARSPGRPRKTRVNSFNMDTDIELDERFIQFRKLTGTSEEKALVTICALYKYAARHCAADGSLAGITNNIIAERIYWCIAEDNQTANQLIQDLITCGILTEELSLSDWNESQPHAVDYARKLKYSESKKKQESKENNGVSDGFDRKIGNRSDQNRAEQNRKSTRSEKRPENVDNRSEVHEKSNLTLANTINDLTETLKIHKGSKDYNAVNDCIHRLHYNSGDDATIRVVSKIKEQFLAGEIKKPVAYVIGTVNKELESIAPEGNSSANQKPTPVCPKCGHLIFSEQCSHCDYTTK